MAAPARFNNSRRDNPRCSPPLVGARGASVGLGFSLVSCSRGVDRADCSHRSARGWRQCRSTSSTRSVEACLQPSACRGHLRSRPAAVQAVKSLGDREMAGRTLKFSDLSVAALRARVVVRAELLVGNGRHAHRRPGLLLALAGLARALVVWVKSCGSHRLRPYITTVGSIGRAGGYSPA